MTEPAIGSFCTGYGGLDMAAQAVFGGSLAWWSDIEPGPIKVMERHSPYAPNIGDIKTADWNSVRPVELLTAGYPCQPFSNAGKRLGTEDPRHIWPHIARAIGVLRPRIIILENVAAHLRRGFDVVSQELAELRYSFAWSVVRADTVGAPHQRKRLFIVAIAQDGDPSADPQGIGRHQRGTEPTGVERGPDAPLGCLPPTRWCEFAPAIARWESVLGRPAPDTTVTGARGGQVLSPLFVEWMMGLPDGHVTGTEGLTRNAQLKLLGNGVVPQQAEYAIRELYGRLM